ncbi:MAG: hypothetical protein HY770_00170, partial [Chitinivibrionia bacterium]|nr:hypothetical protein [Chitinivibrionia bacterium]
MAPVADGAYYLLRFFIKSAFLALLPFALVPPGDRRKLRIWLYLWFLVFVQLFFIVYVGTDVLRFDRFMLPLFPFYFALALSGMLGLHEARAPAVRKAVSRVAIACCVLLMLTNAGQMALAGSKPCAHDWMHGGSLRALGSLMKSALPPGSLVASNEIGALAYYSGFDVIDMLGLTDRTVSRIRYASYRRDGTGSSPEGAARVRDYILSRDPEAVILPSYVGLAEADANAGEGAMHPLWAAFFESERFRTAYARVLSIA